MVDVLKVFYSVHYNFGILSILLVLLLIFFLTKRNFLGAIITLAIVLVMNVALYKRTDGKAWTISIEPEVSANEFGYKPAPKTYTFSVKKDWTIINEKGETLHWCWIDQIWENFASIDLVSKIWGDNKSKKMIKASESHAEGVPE